MSSDKSFFYDWVGANEFLFKQINSLDGNTYYDSLMIFISRLGDHHHFPYVLMLAAVFAGAEFIIRKVSNKAGAGHSIIAWIGVLCVMTGSYVSDGLAVKTLKEHFAYPRPYIALSSSDVKVLEPNHNDNDDYHSFPSGHASFITVVVVSLWPMIYGRAKAAAALLVFLVCWSRIAMGMHFPVDVFYGFLLSFIIVLAVRFIVYTLFYKLFKWKC